MKARKAVIFILGLLFALVGVAYSPPIKADHPKRLEFKNVYDNVIWATATQEVAQEQTFVVAKEVEQVTLKNPIFKVDSCNDYYTYNILRIHQKILAFPPSTTAKNGRL